MATHRRSGGALPLALLILVTLAAGVTLAVLRAGDEEDPKALPTPTATATGSPTFQTSTPAPTTATPSPSPTETESPSPEPTETESPSPEPTESPTVEPTETASPDGPALADTGGPTISLMVMGALMLLLSAGLWRLSREPA